MNKRFLTKECAQETGLTQVQVNKVLSYLFDTAKQELLQDGEIDFWGIGKIHTVNKKTRKHYHPVTKELYNEKEYKTIVMDIYPAFKESLNSIN